MMRWPRKGRWMCVSARCWLESLNLTHQTPRTVLATETVVIASLSADRVRNQGKPSRTRNRSVPTSKRPSGQPAIFLPACASTANDRHDEVAEGLPARASREAGSRGCCGLAAPALSAMKPTVGRSAATRRSQSRPGRVYPSWILGFPPVVGGGGGVLVAPARPGAAGRRGDAV